MIRRLRLKFIVITMIIVTVMMTMLLISQFNFTTGSLTQINMKALEDASREFLEGPPLPEPVIPEHEMPDPGRRNFEKPDFRKPGAEHPCFVLFMDSQGNLDARGGAYYDLSNQAALLDIYQQAAEREKSTGILWDYELRFLRAEGPAQSYYVFTDVSSEVETMKQMARNSILIWILGFFCFLGLSIFLANWAVRPVEQAWEQQRRFVADASHELKTPLTVILTNAELLREVSGDGKQQQFSDSIITMARQMRALVESMLQLARADSGETAGERERVDCSALLEQTLLPFEPMYYEAGLNLEITIQPGIILTCNTAQLRQVAEILLDNALKYASPGGTVRVNLESRGSQCCLSVASPGQTLSHTQCRDIFKRFYRADPARRRTGSYGLGLAIAERMVSDHRGRIWAEGRDGINTFYVNLPVG